MLLLVCHRYEGIAYGSTLACPHPCTRTRPSFAGPSSSNKIINPNLLRNAARDNSDNTPTPKRTTTRKLPTSPFVLSASQPRKGSPLPRRETRGAPGSGSSSRSSGSPYDSPRGGYGSTTKYNSPTVSSLQHASPAVARAQYVNSPSRYDSPTRVRVPWPSQPMVSGHKRLWKSGMHLRFPPPDVWTLWMSVRQLFVCPPFQHLGYQGAFDQGPGPPHPAPPPFPQLYAHRGQQFFRPTLGPTTTLPLGRASARIVCAILDA